MHHTIPLNVCTSGDSGTNGHTYNALYKHLSVHVCPEGPEPTHDTSFSLYKDLLLLAGREAGPERWLLFTEPAPTLKEAQLDFLRFLLRGKKDGRRREGFSEE